MIVKINIYQGDEVTAEYIKIGKEDKNKIKKAAKKYTKEFEYRILLYLERFRY